MIEHSIITADLLLWRVSFCWMSLRLFNNFETKTLNSALIYKVFSVLVIEPGSKNLLDSYVFNVFVEHKSRNNDKNFFIFLPYLGQQTNCTLGCHEIYPTTFSIISSFYCILTCHSARCYFTECCDVKFCQRHIKYSLTMTGDSLMCHNDDLRPSKGQLEYNFFLKSNKTT